MPEKYLVSNAPFLRSADHHHTTKSIMRDVMIALSPAILFAIWKNVINVLVHRAECGATVWQGLYPLVTLIVSPILSMLIEALCLYIMKKGQIKSFKDLIVEVKNGFGMFPGLFIVLISPVYIRFWQLVVSIAVGEVIGKMVFGGFGQNIFNPALVGRAFMAFAFTNNLGTSCFDNFSVSYLNAYELFEQTGGVDTMAGATLLQNLQGLTQSDLASGLLVIGNKTYTLWDLFLGTVPGTLGETSALAILIGLAYLLIRKVIDWRIPAYYIGTVALNTLVIGLFLPTNALVYMLFQVLSGGLLFGAAFMATEPVTSPKTRLGRTMYAVMLGVLTVLFRLVGSLPEGVATAIVTMNVFGIAINRYAVHVKVDGKITKDEVWGLVVFSVLFVLFFVYNVISVVNA